MSDAATISEAELELVRAVMREELELFRAAMREELEAALPESALRESRASKSPLSLDAAAEALGVSRRTVRRLIDRKKLRPLRIGGRVLIPSTQIEGLLRNGT